MKPLLLPIMRVSEALRGGATERFLQCTLHMPADKRAEHLEPKNDQDRANDEYRDGHFQGPEANATEGNFGIGNVPASIGFVSHTIGLCTKHARCIHQERVE